MNLGAVIAAAAIGCLPAFAAAQEDATEPTLDCSTGPAKRTFGGTDWLVYSCSDARTVVIMSAPGNPAMPFYFQFFSENGRYRLVGEGAGNKSATDAAYNELRLLTERDIRTLIDQTQSPSAGEN